MDISAQCAKYTSIDHYLLFLLSLSLLLVLGFKEQDINLSGLYRLNSIPELV